MIDGSDFRHVFIVTYGRTGSTLLINILNSLDGVQIFGENSGFLYSVYRSIRAIEEFKSFATEDTQHSTNAFFGAANFDFDTNRSRLEAIFSSFFDSYRGAEAARIIGFKEVRYIIPDIMEYIEFLDKKFEKSLFIFLTRNPEYVADSGFYKKYSRDHVISAIKKASDDFKDIHCALPDRTHLIDYSDLVNKTERLTGLLARLGGRVDPTELDAIIATPASYGQKAIREIVPGLSLFIDRGAIESHSLYFQLFGLPKMMGLAEDITLEGTVLAQGSDRVTDVYTVRRSDASRTSTNYGLPSPGVAKLFPDHAFSGKCRFQAKIDLRNGTADSYGLFVGLSDGTQVRVARLSAIASSLPRQAGRDEPDPGESD